VPYPGANIEMNPQKNHWVSYHGDYAMVIRGGSFADEERVALRCAFRNFIGIERLKPPIPENRFENVGFRCAHYATPGKDRLQAAIRVATAKQKVRPEMLAVDRFRGAVTEKFTPPNVAVENHVYVTGRSHTILFVPVARLSPTDLKKAPNTVAEVEKYVPSADRPDDLALGILHTDIPLKGRIVDPKAPVTAPVGAGRREGRKSESEPPMVAGIIAPDTYVLGLHHGKLALYRSNLDFVGLVGDKPVVLKALKVKEDQPKPATDLKVDWEMDEIGLTFWLAFGGKGGDENDGFTVSCLLGSETGATTSTRRPGAPRLPGCGTA
jgi:hypothetical protein